MTVRWPVGYTKSFCFLQKILNNIDFNLSKKTNIHDERDTYSVGSKTGVDTQGFRASIESVRRVGNFRVDWKKFRCANQTKAAVPSNALPLVCRQLLLLSAPLHLSFQPLQRYVLSYATSCCCCYFLFFPKHKTKSHAKKPQRTVPNRRLNIGKSNSMLTNSYCFLQLFPLLLLSNQFWHSRWKCWRSCCMR